MKSLLLTVVALGLLGGGGYWYWKVQSQPSTSFALADVKRGRLEATVGSTGTLQPREIVDVGAQVQGRITKIGADSSTQSKIVDWGSEVFGPEFDSNGNITKPGTLLAQIDPLLYQAAVDSSEAQIISTKAQVKSAEAAIDAAKADLLQKNATLSQATKDWTRAETLIKTQGVSQAEYDQFNAAHEVALANVKSSTANIEVAQANLRTANAAIKTAQANLDRDRTNLDYTKITAPVNGVVVDRRVNVGQTVVASLSAPSLFLIAKDLSKTEVWATVNEVDVGKIKIDTDESVKNVTFTVDAYAGRLYHGRVVPQGKLPFRLNATMNQNVVTYTVVVSVDDKENSDGALRPYMTANLNFLVGVRENALMVPNAALRWQPARNQIAPSVREDYHKMRGKKHGPGEADAQDRGVVWIKDEDGMARFIEVKTGLSDSVNTEILQALSGGELPEHAQVIIGETRGEVKGGVGANPFIATPFKAKKKSDSN
jgi:HlyD family secretion protein